MLNSLCSQIQRRKTKKKTKRQNQKKKTKISNNFNVHKKLLLKYPQYNLAFEQNDRNVHP